MGTNTQVAIVADEDAGTSFWHADAGAVEPTRGTDRTRLAELDILRARAVSPHRDCRHP
jgi:hypothetical protein